jgi:hypothetical protein
MKRWLLLIIGPPGGVLLATVFTGELLVPKVAIRAFLFEVVSLRWRGNRGFIPSVPERSWRTPSSTCRPPLVVSDRNPLHDIAGHAPAPAIVNLGGPGVGVAGEVLNVLPRHVLIEQIGHHRYPEAVRGKQMRQARILQPPLEHLPHEVRRVSHRRQLPALAPTSASSRIPR